MKTLLELIQIELSKAFQLAGYHDQYCHIALSKRPDLCDFQCNGALMASKPYQTSPMTIASNIVDQASDLFDLQVLPPGFINITLKSGYLSCLLKEMKENKNFGIEPMEAKNVIIDYGGPNVAKPLHVGHLRSAIIGESIKRLYQFFGHQITGDIHLGDWGLQIGLVIQELKTLYPDLPYFDLTPHDAYPSQPPFEIHELSEIYPKASAKSKIDEEYLKAARDITAQLQKHHPAYRALWQHICDVSIHDLKTNYSKLNVHFDLWKGESHSMSAVEEVIQILTEKQMAIKDDGALIVPIEEATDKKPMPPLILLKSDGAALYSTTDLATIYQRVKAPLDEIIYVVDKRQGLHFEQVFRCALKAQIVDPSLELNFIGFGTMNGTDGKPFKTRDGGIMKLEDLIHMLRQSVKDKLFNNREDYKSEEVDDIAIKVGLAALKYGDLVNISTKDYVFDLNKFATFEGKTGPYILYTIVRIKSILNKAGQYEHTFNEPSNDLEKAIHIKLLLFNHVLHQAFYDKAPHKICDYIYDLSQLFNRFYHQCKILSADENQAYYLTLITLVKDVLEQSLDLLGIYTIDKIS